MCPLWVLWFPPMAGGRGGTGHGGGTVGVVLTLRKSDFISREILTRMAKMKGTDNTKCGQGSKAIETLSHCWWKCTLEPPALEFSADTSNGSDNSTLRNMLGRNKGFMLSKKPAQEGS